MDAFASVAIRAVVKRSVARVATAVSRQSLHAFIEQQCGETAIIVALMMPILIGAMGLSTEVCYWYRHQRAMQNASDAAAIAAATNNTSTYAAEAKAVTAQYGLARKG